MGLSINNVEAKIQYIALRRITVTHFDCSKFFIDPKNQCDHNK